MNTLIIAPLEHSRFTSRSTRSNQKTRSNHQDSAFSDFGRYFF